MAFDYNQQRELQSQVQKTGKNILEMAIVYGFELIKFLSNFIKDMIKMTMGK